MSVIISNLPSYTGSAADLRWLVMNNSGETTTYKYSGYTSPFRYTNNTFSSNNTYDTIALPGSYNKIIGGFNHTLNGNYNAVIGGYSHTFPNQYSSNNFVGGGLSHVLEGGDRHGIIGGDGNYFYGGEQNYGVGGLSNQVFVANNSGIIGGESCSIYTDFGTKHNGIFNGYLNKIKGQVEGDSAKDYNTIINGSNNTISGVSTYYSSIYNGSGNTISSGINSSIFSSKNSSITTTGVANNIIGGFSNDILTDYYETSYASIIGGQNNTISKLMNGSGVIVGGSNNTINAKGESVILGGFGNTMGSYQCVIGGYQCSMPEGSNQSILYGNQSTMYDCNFSILVGQNSTSNNSNHSTNLGGFQNSITNATKSAIIGGNNSSITGGTLVAMVGTSGRTATASATTYVENIHTFRTPSTQVQPVLSGTVFTCNIENGAKSQFYITGTSTVNITNVRDGASFMIKTQTDGNHTMTWTATGYTFVFEGGIKDPGNNVTDIFVFEVFGSVIYGNRRHNYS
jgi:hypothetical protein